MSAPIETVNDALNSANQQDEGFRVYFGNLSFQATEEQIKSFASQSGGEILSVVLPQKFKRPAGFAFVHYKTEAEAQHAVETLNDKEIDGRQVVLQVARSREEQAARREAIIEKRDAAKAARDEKKKTDTANKEIDGDTTAVETDVKPKKKRAPKTSRRRVPGQEDEEAEGAVAGDASEGAAVKEKPKRKTKAKKVKDATEARIDGGEADAAPAAAAPKKEKKPRQPRLELTGEQSPNTIFVANLPFTVDDDALAAIFTNLSIRVKSAKVVQGLRRNRDGRPFKASRGFGFVEIEDASQQKEAVEKVEGSLIGERQISAKIANEMKPIEKEEAAAATEAAPVAA